MGFHQMSDLAVNVETFLPLVDISYYGFYPSPLTPGMWHVYSVNSIWLPCSAIS